jgi:transketolase N-terminal domain/subunit
MDRESGRVFTLMGDGELQSAGVEAIMAAVIINSTI